MTEHKGLALQHDGVMGSEDDVSSFVLQFLGTCGVTYTHVDGIWNVLLPKWLAEHLELPPSTSFTFDPALGGKDVHVVTHGSPILDSMVQIARSRGTISQLIYTGMKLHRTLDQLCANDPWDGKRHGALSEIQFLNARVRPLERRLLHQEQLLFHFKVAYVSDERVEELHRVMVDPITEEVVPTIGEGHAMINLPPLNGRSRTNERATRPQRTTYDSDLYTTRRLYAVACDQLEQMLRPRIAQLRVEADERLEKEQTRVEEYFKGMAAELVDPLRRILRRVASQQARVRLYPSVPEGVEKELQSLKATAQRLEADYREELDVLERDRSRRIAELRERNQVKVEVALTNVAKVLVPRIEWTLRISGPTRREVVVLYDVLRDTVLDLGCDKCEEAAHQLILTGDGDLVCTSCAKETG